jgi:hypothetical protein
MGVQTKEAEEEHRSRGIDESHRSSARIRRWAIRILPSLILVLACIQLFLLVRARDALIRAKEAEAAGGFLEAARWYQTAIGFHTPFSPYSRSAVEAMLRLSESRADDDPNLSFEIRDRLIRAIYATRSFYQPFAHELAGLTETRLQRRYRDPGLLTFLTSTLFLACGLMLLLTGKIPLFDRLDSLLKKTIVVAGVFLLWAVLLFLS